MNETAKLCETCGGSYSSKRANAKYCAVCRMIKDLKFLKLRQQKCFACDKKYAPLSRGEIVCGECEDYWFGSVEGACAFCAQHDDSTVKTLLGPDVAVCLPCAKDPTKRSLLMKALRNKQDERLKARAAA